MEDKLVKIAEYETGFEAELAKTRLEAEGIKAAALGADLVANMHTIQLAMVELQVFEKDVEKATPGTEKEKTMEDKVAAETGKHLANGIMNAAE